MNNTENAQLNIELTNTAVGELGLTVLLEEGGVGLVGEAEGVEEADGGENAGVGLVVGGGVEGGGGLAGLGGSEGGGRADEEGGEEELHGFGWWELALLWVV